MTTLTLVLAATLAGGPTPDQTAERVNRLVAEALVSEGVTPAPQCSDEDFLRRVSLDLSAELPSPTDVTRFGLDSSEQKRARVIDELARSEAADGRWARYWNETILVRATNARIDRSRGSFERWLTEELSKGSGWDEIVTAMLTATGDVRENGATAFIFAHEGDAAELASETSRLFTGIQMSCANCHDHPSDDWKRTQFHELAAYFPRVRVRRTGGDNGPRSFEVTSQDRSRNDRSRIIQAAFRADRNRDGKLSKREAENLPQLADRFERLVGFIDKDGDGQLSRDELQNATFPGQQRNEIEHYMADLDNPTEKGQRMEPVFFVNGDALKADATDMQRRTALARSITTPDNPWFAKATVNRYWNELVGEGFYMPVDDLGPGREAMLENVLTVLAHGFERNDYDLRWLLRTITRTEAYQRGLAPSPLTDFTAGATSLSSTRIDADQVYGSLRGALGVDRVGYQGTQKRGPFTVATRERTAIKQTFGEDPSVPKADLLGRIPQVLLLMNSSSIEQQIRASGSTRLAQLLKDFDNDTDVAIELYLAVLSREPSDAELDIVLTYVDEHGRREGFEDVYWSLINSAEFLSRR